MNCPTCKSLMIERSPKQTQAPWRAIFDCGCGQVVGIWDEEKENKPTPKTYLWKKFTPPMP